MQGKVVRVAAGSNALDCKLLRLRHAINIYRILIIDANLCTGITYARVSLD